MSNTVNYIINGVEEIVRDVLDYLIDESGKPENKNQEQQKVRHRGGKKICLNFDFKRMSKFQPISVSLRPICLNQFRKRTLRQKLTHINDSNRVKVTQDQFTGDQRGLVHLSKRTGWRIFLFLLQRHHVASLII